MAAKATAGRYRNGACRCDVKGPASERLSRSAAGLAVVVESIDGLSGISEVSWGSDWVEGYLRASEISRDRVEDARSVLKLGEEVTAKFLGVDRKNRSISLSIKAKDMEEEQATLKGYTSGGHAGTATLGDILKGQMEDQKD